MNRTLVLVLSILSMVARASGFVSPLERRSVTSLPMALMAPNAASAPISFVQSAPSTASSSLSDGIGRYTLQEHPSSIMTSTTVLSLKERPPPPTAEEIAAKKATFNLWFWGGGFVAPFLATFYYFGFKFWER